MALGRLETFHAATGQMGSIRGADGKARDNILWHGHPAWQKDAPDGIVDGPRARPYIHRWEDWHGQPQIVYNMQHKARAGRIHPTKSERLVCAISGRYAVISPHVKDNASLNKQWGIEKWEQVIANFPIKVYQLGPEGTEVIRGARHYLTPTMRHAAAVIDGASIVLSNEGGTHHLAAAMKTPAVVVFGAFIPPSVTGYDGHENISVETEYGYCGRYAPCDHCNKAMASITVDMVKEKAMHLLGA